MEIASIEGADNYTQDPIFGECTFSVLRHRASREQIIVVKTTR